MWGDDKVADPVNLLDTLIVHLDGGVMRDSSDRIECFGGSGDHLEIRLFVSVVTGTDLPGTRQWSDIPHCLFFPVLCQDPSFCLRLLRFQDSRDTPRDPLERSVWGLFHGVRNLPGAPNKSYYSSADVSANIN